MGDVSAPACDAAHDFNPTCNDVATAAPPDPSQREEIVYKLLDSLIRSAKNFNLHITVMKRLLNLEEPQPEFYARAIHPLDMNSFENLVNSETGLVNQSGSVMLNVNELVKKISIIKKEFEGMQLNGFCLAYNLQRQQKRLTGLPLDANATDDVVQDLWIRFNESKSSEAILKYEFEEKRKLLRRLRKELEQARRDWKNLKIRITDPDDPTSGADVEPRSETQGTDPEWSEASQDWSNRLSSESDSAVHSDEGGDDDQQLNSTASSACESRSRMLGRLERECLQFVTQLVNNNGSVNARTSDQQNLTTGEEEERFHSPMPVPSNYLLPQISVDSSSDEDASLLVDSDELVDDDEEDDVDDDDSDEIDFEAALMAEGGLNAFVDDLLLNAAAAAAAATASAETIGDNNISNNNSNQHHGTMSQIESLPVPEMEPNLVPGVNQGTDALNVFMRSRTSSRSSQFDEGEEARLRESLAETGEPVVLCRLRRRAVEILISRLREEKAFHETREKELENKLKDVTARNRKLEDRKGGK